MTWLLALALLLCCLPCQALTPFYLRTLNGDGSANTNQVFVQAWPLQTNLFTTYGTNVIFGAPVYVYTPDNTGYFTNALEPNVYRVTLTNFGSGSTYAFTVNLPDSGALTPLASCVTNLPIYPGAQSMYAVLTNWLGFAPATNSSAGILFWLNPNGVLTNAYLSVSTNLLANHFGGYGTGPTVAVNTNGAGNGGSVAIDANASDAAFTVTVTTTVPAANTAMFTNTYGRPYATAPHITWSASSFGARLLTTNAFVTNATATSFEFWSGNSAWASSSNFPFTFHVIQ